MTVERAALSSSRRRGEAPRKGDLKEAAILETCERLLAERPLKDIGVDELAAGAGISRPSFYFYFESKDAVLRTLVERLADELYAESEAWIARAGDPPEVTIQRSLEAGVALWRAHGPVLRAAVQTWGTVPEMRAVWEGIVGRFVTQAAASIREERAGGAAPAGPDPLALAEGARLDERALPLHRVARRLGGARRRRAAAHALVDLAAGDLRRGQASIRRVTGPSFTSATCMCAPNTPPSAPSASRTRS